METRTVGPDSCLAPNLAEIAAKVIDGEAIIINLATGVYFSAEKVGGAVWELIEQGQRLGDVVEALTRLYDVDRVRADADVQRFVEELLRQNLVVARSNGHGPLPPLPSRPANPEIYEPPVLHAHTDMSELLALDPPVPGLEDLSWTK